MLWIIGQADQSTIPETTETDVGYLNANTALGGQLTRQLYEYRLKQVKSVLAPPVAAGETIYVMAHAGYDDLGGSVDAYPWIGGVKLNPFARYMATKFTPAGLSGRDLWFLICLVGDDVKRFARRLARRGVRSANIYMPTDFMYISTEGIPHIITGYDDVDSANRAVARGESEYLTVVNSMPTGSRWAGARIDADGVVTAIAGNEVECAVVERFDPEEKEA